PVPAAAVRTAVGAAEVVDGVTVARAGPERAAASTAEAVLEAGAVRAGPTATAMSHLAAGMLARAVAVPLVVVAIAGVAPAAVHVLERATRVEAGVLALALHGVHAPPVLCLLVAEPGAHLDHGALAEAAVPVHPALPSRPGVAARAVA